MDRYQRVERPRPESAITENEVRITAQGLIRNYVNYALNLLQERRLREIVLKAMGQAISKTVALAEILKKRVPGLHQDTCISSVSITDVWEPIEEGLVPLETTRHVSMISISLSIDELNKESPGYQAPEEIQEFQQRPRYNNNQPRQIRYSQNDYYNEESYGGRGGMRGGRGRGYQGGGYRNNQNRYDNNNTSNENRYENNNNNQGRYENNNQGRYNNNNQGRYENNQGHYENNNQGRYNNNQGGRYENNNQGGRYENYRGGYNQGYGGGYNQRYGGYNQDNEGYNANRGRGSGMRGRGNYGGYRGGYERGRGGPRGGRGYYRGRGRENMNQA